MKGPCALAFLALAASVALAQERAARPEPDVKDARYGPHERNVLDLYLAKADAPTPLLVFIHGGGFRAGSKEQVSPALIRRCRDASVSVAAINYRFSQHAPFPAPMHDAARALQLLRSRAKEWNLDPERFGATGGSAGAGISLWLAFHADLADPTSGDPVARESTRLRCVVGHGAQTSYDPRWIERHVGGRAHEHPALLPFYGLAQGELGTEKAAKLFQEASPIAHLTKDDPPVYLLYGRDEPSDKPGAGIHSDRFGHALKERMDELGIECVVKTGGDPGDGSFDFLFRHLKRRGKLY